MKSGIQKIFIWILSFSLALPSFSVSAYANELPNESQEAFVEQINEIEDENVLKTISGNEILDSTESDFGEEEKEQQTENNEGESSKDIEVEDEEGLPAEDNEEQPGDCKEELVEGNEKEPEEEEPEEVETEEPTMEEEPEEVENTDTIPEEKLENNYMEEEPAEDIEVITDELEKEEEIEEFDENNTLSCFTYEVLGDGTICITGCDKDVVSVDIPNEIESLIVTCIGESAFSDCSNLSNITLPEGLTTVGDMAFLNCSNLSNITLPEGVISIGNDAFKGCSGKFVICGKPGSYVQTYADELGIPFVDSGLPLPYIIVFDKNNESATGSMEKQLIISDSGVKLNSNLYQYMGHVFKGWNTKANGTGMAFADMAEVSVLSEKKDEIVTLYAQWEPVKYGIKYSLGGGKNSSKNPTSYTIATANIKLQNPSKTGYRFKGWYSDKNCTKQVKIIPKGSMGNKTLYAKWEVVKYSIKYNLNGGKNHSKNPTSYKVTTSNIKLQSPTRTSYKFKGWYSDKKYTKQVRTITKGSAGNIILYAKWEPVKYSIKYNLGGGKNSSKNPANYTIASSIKLYNPTRTGYMFKGWYSDKKCTKRVKSIPKGSTGRKTLYAKWEVVKYSIRYNLNGGKNHKKNPTSYKVTTSSIKLQSPTRTNYKFKGWYSDKKYTKQVRTITKGSAGNIILYAKWEPIKYSIKYNLNGGKNHSKNPANYPITTQGVKLYNPTREGYRFKGWYSDKNYTKQVKSIPKGSKGIKTLYAKWEVVPIGTVEIPKEYLNVCDYGATPGDKTNDTKAFYDALYAAYIGGIKTVYVPRGIYRISATNSYTADSGIYMWSNTKLIMDNNAILYVEGDSKPEYSVIKGFKSKNVTIQGGQIQGERNRHKGSGGESGHGISLFGCSNVVITDMSIASNWGDGIYLGTWYDAGSGTYTGNNKITIEGCEIKDNRRNNISIIDADNVTIERCYIADAHGTAPQCGICIEPNKGSCSGDEICSNILIKDTTMKAYGNKNEVNYWCFMTTANGSNASEHPEYVTANKIRFENCIFNGYVGNYSGNNLTIDNKTKFNGTFVSWRNYKKE